MSYSICTGEYVDAAATVTGDCGLQEAPLDPTMLFDARSTSPLSRSFQLVDGEAALLTAYSACGCTVCVEKVLLNKPQLPLSQGSCECKLPEVPTPEEVASTTLCNWCLGSCAEIRYITVPGTYRLRINGSQSCIGCVTVTMERVKRAQMPIPDGLTLGA